MRANHVLIDYENVQPKNLSLLEQEHFRIKVFIGSNQTKIPVDLASAMQVLGSRAGYVKISGNGPNALDFHIAYYIGRIASIEPDAYFHIISKDTGFDPLIAHLKDQGIFSKRSATLDSIPILRNLTTATRDEQVEAVIEKLRGMPKSRPQKDKTLRAMISAWFGKKLDLAALDRIINELSKRKAIDMEGGRIKYDLPT